MPLCHNFSTVVDVTICNLQKNNIKMLLDTYKQGQTRVMLLNIWGFAEPLLTGFECVTTIQEALVTD